MNQTLGNVRKELEESKNLTKRDDWYDGFNAGIKKGIRAIQELGKQVVSVQTVQELLKESFRQTTDNCKIDNLISSDDNVSIIANTFLQLVLNKLAQVNDPSTIKVIGESENSVFPMKIRCQRMINPIGEVYGDAIDFCGHELEIESYHIKFVKWSAYPDTYGKDYGVICPICKRFVIIDEKKLPQYAKDAAEEISLCKDEPSIIHGHEKEQTAYVISKRTQEKIWYKPGCACGYTDCISDPMRIFARACAHQSDMTPNKWISCENSNAEVTDCECYHKVSVD